MAGSAPHFLVVVNACRSPSELKQILMETTKLAMYIAPESEEVKCELDGMILSGSLKPGESEGGQEGDEL
jgi:hypothetical protein